MNMSKGRVFFLLFSFFNCIFLSIQAPTPLGGKSTPEVPNFINYEKKALELLEITAAPGCTVDWKEAFLKIAPIAIHNAYLAKANADLANKNSVDAGRYHFILLSRNMFVFAEDHYCLGLPENDNEFRNKIKEDTRFKNIPNEKISCKKHAKKWLWMLVKGDGTIFTQLDSIRKALNNDAEKFLWFATQIQRIFDIFNDDVHSPSFSLLDPRHVHIQDLGTYMTFLNKDVRDAMKIYYESDGFEVNLNGNKS